MVGELDTALREEIVEAQKAKTEFLRWKLILVAAVGGAAFGLEDKGERPVLLALIPLLCIYVDSACLHNDSRILIIGSFLRTSELASPEARAYEQYCHEHRERFYGEGMVLFLSSLFLSLVVTGRGLYAAARDENMVAATCLVSGLVGTIVTFILLRNSRRVQKGQEPWQIVPQSPHRE